MGYFDNDYDDEFENDEEEVQELNNVLGEEQQNPLNISILGILAFLFIALIVIFFFLGRVSAKISYDKSLVSAVNAENMVQAITETATVAETTVTVTTTEEITTVTTTVTTVKTVDEQEVIEIISSAESLVSENYRYHSSEVYENSRKAWGVKVPFTTDIFVFSFDGEITVGIDFSEILVEVDNEYRTIYILMPEPEIFSHIVDESSFEFTDAKNAVFSDMDFSNYSGMISDQKDREERKIKHDWELLDSVTYKAEQVIISFLNLSENTSDYQVVFE